MILANLSNPRQNTRETQTLKVVLGHPRLQFRADDTEWSRSLRGPSSARAMAEELFALRGPQIDDLGETYLELPNFTILRKKGKVSRSRYLRRHRSERYLKGTHSAGLTANFPNMSTVGPHEFCRRSYSRRAALWE